MDVALARCPTEAELALVDAVVILTVVDDPTAGMLVCHRDAGSRDLTRLEERAYQAVLSMHRIAFDAPLPWTDRSLFDWFGAAVTEVKFRPDAAVSYCCDGPGVIVIKSSNMAFLESDLWAARDGTGFGLMSLVGLLAHEARHAEGYWHTCGNLDQTLEEMGAWAIHHYVWICLAEHAHSAYTTPVNAAPDLYERAAVIASRLSATSFCTLPSPSPGRS